MIYFILVVWCVVGFFGTLYNEEEIDLNLIAFAIICSVMGPINWIEHLPDFGKIIVWKKENKK